MLWGTPGSQLATKLHDYNLTHQPQRGVIAFLPIPPPAHSSRARNSTNSSISCAPATPWWCGDSTDSAVRFATSSINSPNSKTAVSSSDPCKKPSTPPPQGADSCSTSSHPWRNLNATSSENAPTPDWPLPGPAAEPMAGHHDSPHTRSPPRKNSMTNKT